MPRLARLDAEKIWSVDTWSWGLLTPGNREQAAFSPFFGVALTCSDAVQHTGAGRLLPRGMIWATAFVDRRWTPQIYLKN